ncbi:hypothetical protein OGR47_00645 [Methylocystis sp. MJC1]|jgi:hypothetical protein|uniref:hypothetical protein n=1 Tax=Methylocystis sp. MJC1 TaxID=2654282 RepID=UPI0013EC4C01|nr:hypothetical protein [Methylocystis sp. MJC1]KAF2992038.1 hypothetical protein MJC1_01061 [Methylocystis sp. MJC1]MBU6525526.1 hypothetical protein [Methylocystis sp. MJC1]UZX12011.1 hypothetical protein OGR47_00645 [Methylocystis sp. MJC1]
MIQNRSRVNGILAAVLSASIVPMHGALAKPKSPDAPKSAAKKIDTSAVKKMHQPAAAKDDAAKSETSGTNAPATVTQ